MIDQKLTEDSFFRLAMAHYDNAQCVNMAEFEEDLKRFAYLKKLFCRYRDSGDLKERLVINHLTVLHNIFGLIAGDFLFFKIDKQHWNTLATFLVFLNRMPESIPDLGVSASSIGVDNQVLQKLRSL